MGKVFKTRSQLVEELESLSRHISRLEKLDTERKDAESSIKRAAEEWRTTFDSITDLVSIHDKDFKITRVNMACANALKMPPQELIGKTCYELIHGTTEPCRNCPHKQALETRRPHTTEYYEPRLGVHLEISASPILNGQNETVGTVHITKDITARKQMEDTLRESEERYRALVDLRGEVGEAVVMLQDTTIAEGIHTFISDTWIRITGYSSEELLGMSFFDLVHPRDRTACLERHQRRMEGENLPGFF